MSATGEWRRVSSDDREWWLSRDESYWQALLEQGEIAPEVIPPSEPIDTSSLPEAHPEKRDQGVTASPDAVPAQDADHQWELAKLAWERGDSLCLKVSGANRGGLLVDWNGLQGFVPASHLRHTPRHQDPHQRVSELAQQIGESLTVRLIAVEPQQRRLVFSERAALSVPGTPAVILESLAPGQTCRGTVTNLTNFGAFVDLGGVEGLIHISELAWDRIRHPSDVLHPGQAVEAYVLGVNPDERRIALSLKRLRPNPWLGIESRYHVGQVVEGLVTHVVNFGAFVRVEEGLEGLVHISEMPENNSPYPRNVLHEGDKVRVRVLNVDPANQRLGLSLRQGRDAGGQAGGQD
jgi:small subunit ribosomal protein S1